MVKKQFQTLSEFPRRISKMFAMNGYGVRAKPVTSIRGSPAAVTKGHLNDERQSENDMHGIIGSGPVLKAVLDQIRVVAPADSTVLIQGETGTGKELLARAVHKLSPRRDAPFVILNCAAVPAGLLESELFGHERGAFTGALTQRIGRFELANGGTLFLDEIGDISLDLQVKLLRVLQEKEFERVGSTRTCRVDVRVVAATNHDLLQMIDDQSFRADLYYRLSVFPILLPPLRERPEDIPALVRHFVAKYAERMNKALQTIPSETMEAMLSYNWPGNIRELQNFVERGVIISRGAIFEPDLHQIRHRRTKPCEDGPTLDGATRNHILRTLDEVNWVIGGQHGAASRLGIPRTTLISTMRRLGIESRRGMTRGGDTNWGRLQRSPL
jgi:formate hydrogenlyase transcriptional activator